MAIVYEEPNFEELSERVLLKAFLVWVKLRFVVPLKLVYPKYEMSTIVEINKISNNKLVAIVSSEDIWIVQKNAALFNTVARAFAKHFMGSSPDLYSAYGAIEFQADRKRQDSAILMTQVEFKPSPNELLPCIMYVKSHAQILKDYKDHGTHNKSQIDIIPLLKSKRNVFLTPEENAVIDKAYNDFKEDPQFLQNRTNIETERYIEERHLKAVLKSINRQGQDSSTTKLAIAMHTIVDMSYKHDAHNVLKVSHDGRDATPIMDFSKLFTVGYDVDLEYVEAILRPSINSNIKINVGKGRILFTTKSGVDPNDPALVESPTTLIVKSKEALDHYFDTHVGHVTALEDVENIMQRILQHKYKDYY